MRNRIGVGLGLLGCLLSGCVTERVTHKGVALADHRVGTDGKSLSVTDGRSWFGNGPADKTAGWDWTLAMPNALPRAELIRAEVPAESLAALIPDYPGTVIAASATRKPSGFVIAAVQGHAVKNCDQLNSEVERALAGGKPVSVALAGDEAGDSSPVALQVKPSALLALDQAAAPEHAVLRVTEDGNQWVLFRQGGVRCKLLARVERSQGLLQVVTSLGVCWGREAKLPVEVQASCDGRLLQCLTAADTLELLYGREKRKGTKTDASRCSFAAVSEREDYLVPTNYKRLLEAQTANTSTPVPSVPALATVAGVAYPGPALLGDARRALGAFLLQKQICQAGEPARVNWVMFSGEALRQGKNVQLMLNLGDGPVDFAFALPR